MVASTLTAAPVARKSLIKIKDETTYYAHQVVGVRAMARMTSFLLADDMGLGKTLQSLTVAAIDFEKGYARRVLVICPAFLKWNWADEIDKFTNFTYQIYEGTPTQRKAQREDFEQDILIINYEQAVNDLEALLAMEWDIIICDEAHYVKERTSKRTKAVHRLAAAAQRSFLLTGSPILNRPNELWSLLHIINPERFKKYWSFVYRYCVMGGWKNKQIVGVKNKAELRSILGEVMIRRMKSEVLDIPDKEIIDVFVDLEPTVQRPAYDALDKEMMLEIPGDPTPMEVENALTKMLRHKQICGTPATIGLADKSSKLDRLMEMIKEKVDGDPPEPVVVFTQFRGVLEAIEQRCERAGIPCWAIHGDVKKHLRMETRKEWEESPQPGVLIVMLQMGIGMNLTHAKIAFFVDRLYSPKLNEQAEDRLHRIGADDTQPVQIVILHARKTIEQRIATILTGKSKLFKTLVEDSVEWKAMLLKALKEEAEAA